jgi:hypothetical protein
MFVIIFFHTKLLSWNRLHRVNQFNAVYTNFISLLIHEPVVVACFLKRAASATRCKYASRAI